MLHHNRETFEQVILRVAEDKKIAPEIIEKDYYVTLFLKKIKELQPNLIFKGGTSLSKCYKLINRFSEDIDLNIETEAKPTEGQRKKLKANIVSVIDEFGFVLSNPDKVHSRRDYNKYIIDYPTVFNSDYLKENLIVETAVYIKAYPCKEMQATSIIYDFLKENGYDNLIAEYNLEPFNVNVQAAERTLIDKLYALGDYYLCDAVQEHSRHIYDIYKLLDIVELNDELRMLAKAVFEERKGHPNCHSAKDDIDMNKLLQEIIDSEAYKKDYQDITEKIVFDNINYSTAIKALQTVVDSKLF
ncbi:MAG: nucleotidyl transferase AbiEii/AbiGii toxin family protein [Clostridia bacterium]|nr:nucleotidyl transferase AbiEii/AbiGii toxin family protein [Clostridia bacterium]